MAGKEGERKYRPKKSRATKGPAEGLRVLAKLTVSEGNIIPLEILGLPRIDLNTGQRILPEESAANKEQDDKRKSQ